MLARMLVPRYGCSSAAVLPCRERFWVVTYRGIWRIEAALSIFVVVVIPKKKKKRCGKTRASGGDGVVDLQFRKFVNGRK